ncbi:MAG: hypothetical protein M1826_001684 [Phylliscum demangeonii]|nr:MAG: hypothetical protein M1826_001684 [Phylliscum demangeonii]
MIDFNYPGSTLKSFDLHSLYFGCTVNSQQTEAGAIGCTVQVTATKAGTGATVGPKLINFAPANAVAGTGVSLQSGMAFASFSDLTGLSSVTLQIVLSSIPAAAQADTVLYIDDVVHTNHDLQLGEAVLDFVHQGTFPASEDVISAQLSTSALPAVLDLLVQARGELRDHIVQRVRRLPPDIEGWITEARQLHADIEDAEAQAQEISAEAQEWLRRQEDAKDAEQKRALLHLELEYNSALADVLENINGVTGSLDAIQDHLAEHRFVEAVSLLKTSEEHIHSLKLFQTSTALSLVEAEIATLRRFMVDDIGRQWDDCVAIDAKKRSMTVKSGESPVEISALVTALQALAVFRPTLNLLVSRVETAIFSPVMDFWPGDKTVSLNAQRDTIEVSERNEQTTAQSLLHDLESTFSFFSDRLPSSLAISLSRILVPRITSKLISPWLLDAVPLSVKDLPVLYEIQSQVARFRDMIRLLEWKGEEDLTDWIENAPQVWMSKRREVSLDGIREILPRYINRLKVVERTEAHQSTNSVLPGDARVHLGDEAANPQINSTAVDDEEDLSAWGLDEEESDHKKDSGQAPADEAEEAWGWAEDNDGGPSTDAQAERKASKTGQANGHAPPHERPSALRETYAITGIPEPVLETIRQLIDDAMSLASARSDPAYAPLASAISSLYSVPSLILAMYRASSPYYYAKLEAGNALLYNDSLWLAEQLAALDKVHLGTTAAKPLFDADLATLEVFGKVRFETEMETQRNTLRDFLRQTRGFVNCALEPYSTECDNAVNAIVDHVRGLHGRWTDVLPTSSLLQSLGLLLSTVTSAIVVDIEDMSDISEVESQQLARLCSRISNLEDLFLPSGTTTTIPGQAPDVPLTAVYSPHWLRFQFLVQILESSLADIKYFWNDGGLKLEFSAEEVVDLIEALFADSELRRRLIGEIRRSSAASS